MLSFAFAPADPAVGALGALEVGSGGCVVGVAEGSAPDELLVGRGVVSLPLAEDGAVGVVPAGVSLPEGDRLELAVGEGEEVAGAAPVSVSRDGSVEAAATVNMNAPAVSAKVATTRMERKVRAALCAAS
jgi:hypothetical protein